MVSKQEALAVDEAINTFEKSLTGLPAEVKRRIVQLRANPGEVISRIQQIDGLIVEFEERF